MNKSELIEHLADTTGTSKSATKRHLEALVSTIHETLHDGDTVQIPGLGKFDTRVQAERAISNPLTGSQVVPAKVVPRFKPGADFKRKIAELPVQ